MNSQQQLRRNIAANLLGHVVHLAVTFLLTPFVLGTLGETRYGVWALVNSLVGYYGLLDLGSRAGVTRTITHYWSAGEVESMNRVAGAGLAVLVGCGLVLTALTAILTLTLGGIWHVEPGLLSDARICIALIGVSTALQLPLFPFAAAFTATHRLDIANVIGIATRILSAVATCLALKQGGGLVALSAVIAGTNLLDYLIRFSASRFVLPELKPRWTFKEWSAGREILTFGFWNSLIVLGTRLIWYTDALVIGWFMPLAAVGRFALATSLTAQFSAVFVPIGQAYFPPAALHVARGESQKLIQLYLGGSRLLIMAAGVLGVLSMACAKQFYDLWLNGRVSASPPYPHPAVLFSWLLIGAVATSGQRAGYQVLLAGNRPRVLAFLIGGEALLNLGLSILLVRPFGLLGVAIGTLMPALLMEVMVHPFVVCRFLEIPVRDYVCASLLPGVLPAALLLVPSLWFSARWTIHGWGDFSMLATTQLAMAGVIVYLFGLSLEQRWKIASLLGRAIRRFAPRMGEPKPSGCDE